MGATFRLESHLCSALSSRWELALSASDNGLRVFSEFQVGSQRADFLAVRLPARPRRGARRLTELDCGVLVSLSSVKGTPVDAIADRLYARPSKVLEILARLERGGLCRRDSSGEYLMAEDALPLGSEVIAVEAKLYRWRDAVSQAAAYLAFSNRAFVALPGGLSRAQALLARDACLQLGLGLLSVSSDAIEVLADAPYHAVCSAQWAWVVSKALRHSRGLVSPAASDPPARTEASSPLERGDESVECLLPPALVVERCPRVE